MSTPFQLICNDEWQWSDIAFSPLLVSEKIDGVFTGKVSDRFITRQNKIITNPYVRECLDKLPNGVVGELVTTDDNGIRDNFHVASGKLRRKYQREPLRFIYYIFDLWNQPTLTFESRLALLSKIDFTGISQARVLPHYSVKTKEEVQELVKYWESLNPTTFEGAIIRNPLSFYKLGRTTVADQNAFKLITYHYEQVTYAGVTENSTHRERIGAILVNWQGKKIPVGTGFDHALSIALRANPLLYIPGQTPLRIRYKSLTESGVPREPSLVI